jgi:hypothetical protein
MKSRCSINVDEIVTHCFYVYIIFDAGTAFAKLETTIRTNVAYPAIYWLGIQ